MHFNLQLLLLSKIFVVLIDCQFSDYPKCELEDESTIILSTKNGKIKGACYNVSISNGNNSTDYKSVLTWLSIPYAMPPIGDLRFLSPQPSKPWNGVLNGTIRPYECKSAPYFSVYSLFNSSEDCLYLNIYSPFDSYKNTVITKNSSQLLPIYVFIHGGAFVVGSSSYYDGSRIAVLSNIIVITLNYRLGPFGFFYIKGTQANGNQALLDQNLALKWIYENAAEFGGDKERITIGGESAGSWSVGYHLVFKKSWPYFRNAILQSGTPFRPYYGTRLLSSDEANLIATNIGKSVDCIDQNSLLNCLQSVSVDLINNKSYEFTTYAALVRDSNVFDQEPKQLFEKGEFKQCRILTGSNNYEELNMVDFDIPGYDVSDLKGGKLTSFKKLLKKRLSIDDSTLVNKIISLYVPQDEIKDFNEDYFIHYVKIITDYQFKCSTYQLAQHFTKFNQSAYVYLYGHKSSKDTQQLVDGASHTDELEFIFGSPLSGELNYTNAEKYFSQEMIDFWSDFIKYENIKVKKEWIRFNDSTSSENRNIFFLKSNNITNTIYSINDPICKFWNEFQPIQSSANKAIISFYLFYKFIIIFLFSF